MRSGNQLLNSISLSKHLWQIPDSRLKVNLFARRLISEAE